MQNGGSPAYEDPKSSGLLTWMNELSQNHVALRSAKFSQDQECTDKSYPIPLQRRGQDLQVSKQ